VKGFPQQLAAYLIGHIRAANATGRTVLIAVRSFPGKGTRFRACLVSEEAVKKGGGQAVCDALFAQLDRDEQNQGPSQN